jgi:hypothetical protein
MFGCCELSLLSAAVGFPVNRCILEASVLLGAYVDKLAQDELSER